ncbi:hypothetical protein HJC23_009143 [Cyclotella cryptica]|uniref:PX domain-containing protein n=1 Tax=Cyclotella cryptica TaxID=29204 RepID=A0ABD3P0I1_9STRA
MMYLPEDKWSSRYDKQFYTIKMKTYTILDNPPKTTDTFNQDTCQFLGICGNAKLPAIFYTIDVFSGTDHHSCLRRYSQFRQLCNKIDPKGKLGIRSKLPPKTGPFHKDSSYFLEDRLNGLHAFLRELLTRQDAVGNLWVQQFLELDIFRGDPNM